MTDQATRYRCKFCGAEKFLPEPPLSPTPKARTGCDHCEGLTPHHPVGTPHGEVLAR